jgi:hypothetical protein
MKMEKAVCSETSAYKIQTPGNYPKEITQILSDVAEGSGLLGCDALLYNKPFAMFRRSIVPSSSARP